MSITQEKNKVGVGVYGYIVSVDWCLLLRLHCVMMHKVGHTGVLLASVFASQTYFPLLNFDIGSDVGVQPLGPMAPELATWMYFSNIAAALRYLHSEEGGSLHIQHTPVSRAAKANTMQEGYIFFFRLNKFDECNVSS